jgi:hypothetical protein
VIEPPPFPPIRILSGEVVGAFAAAGEGFAILIAGPEKPLAVPGPGGMECLLFRVRLV